LEHSRQSTPRKWSSRSRASMRPWYWPPNSPASQYRDPGVHSAEELPDSTSSAAGASRVEGRKLLPRPAKPMRPLIALPTRKPVALSSDSQPPHNRDQRLRFSYRDFGQNAALQRAAPVAPVISRGRGETTGLDGPFWQTLARTRKKRKRRRGLRDVLREPWGRARLQPAGK
jgi:hypothetical protein